MRRYLVIAALAPAVGAAEVRFTAKPKAARTREGAKISFAVFAPTDAEVAVLDSKGKIIRHLAAGLLGAKPPRPFRRGLRQEIEWDGRDDEGKPAAGGPFKVRVRLGLRANFDGFIGGSPENQGNPVGLGCDPAGNLYVMSTWSAPNGHYPGMEIKSFDRNGRYRHQVVPYPASLPQERLAGIQRVTLADGTSVPLVYHGANHCLYPQFGATGRQSILFRADGRLVTTNAPMGDGPHGFGNAERRVILLGADGSVGEDYLGPKILKGEARGSILLALSPDGKTIYLSGARSREKKPVPAVFLTSWDNPGEPEVFIGDERKPGRGEKSFAEPRGIATDKDGNIYVCDHLNNRVSVFSPEGKPLGQLEVPHADLVAVHPETGAVYVLTTEKLLKFKNHKAGKPTAVLDLPSGSKTLRMALDGSAQPPVIWLQGLRRGGGQIKKIIDKGSSFEDKGTPIKDRVSAGAVPIGYIDVAVDPHTDEVLVGKTTARRYDGRRGEYRGLLRFESHRRMHRPQWGESEFAADGRTVLYQTHKGLFRFDREGKPAPWPGRQADERATHEVAGDLLQGFMHTRGLAAGRDGSFYVLHHRAFRAYRDGRVSQVGPEGTIVRSDIVQTDVPVGGIRVGRGGHIYVGVHLKPAGQLLPDWFAIFPRGHLLPAPKAPAGWGTAPGQLPPQVAPWYVEQYGSLVKFGPEGGRLVFHKNGAYFAPLLGGERNGWSPNWRSARGSVKADGVEWMWYGLSPMPSRRGTSRHLGGPRCSCQTPRFDLDAHERVYVPDPFRFGVAVLDAAGNLITRFGQYGNQDDPGDGAVIPLAWPHAVAAGSEAVYVADMVNHRLVAVKLEAAAQAECAVR